MKLLVTFVCIWAAANAVALKGVEDKALLNKQEAEDEDKAIDRYQRYYVQPNTANQQSLSNSGFGGTSTSTGEANAGGDYGYYPYYDEPFYGDFGDDYWNYPYYGYQNNQANQQSVSNSGDFGTSKSSGIANAGPRRGKRDVHEKHSELEDKESESIHHSEESDEEVDEEKREVKELVKDDELGSIERVARYYPNRPWGGQYNQANQQSVANSGHFGTSQASGQANAGGYRPYYPQAVPYNYDPYYAYYY